MNAHQSKYLFLLAILMLLLSALACTNMLFIDNQNDCMEVGGTWRGSTCYTPSEGEKVDGSTSSSEGDSNSTTETENNDDLPEGSIQQDDGNNEMDGVDEEESTNIPAGTYIGSMVVDLSMTRCVFENLGNAVTVNVADNGTVTGSISHKFTLTCIEQEGCIPIAETTYISDISGQITDTNNTIEIHETHSFFNIVRCHPPEDYTEENTIIAELQVSGDKMTCTIPGEGNRLYFEATKQ